MENNEKPARTKRHKRGATTPVTPILKTGPAPAGTDEDARRAKIAAIKKSLADGTYHVSNEDVARKVIEHMLQPKKSDPGL
jgi:anti-sigma28 factor (negative regulator of flagellin synthesis)